MRLPPASGLLLLAAGFAALSPQPAARAQRAGPPNLVFILADDLGYGDLGCYGQQQIKTPNLDRMAAEGMRFTQAYAGSTVCAPSRSVLMTGLHTGHTPVRGNREVQPEGQAPLPAGTVTVAGLLKGAGYATGAAGKWGLGYPGSTGEPLRQGFDFFYGYNCQRQAHNYYPEHLWLNGEKVLLEGNVGGRQAEYSHDLIAGEALGFIRRVPSGRGERPFFLYVPFTIPHTRFQVPDLGPYAATPWSAEQKTQAAMITRMDRDVGRILDLLRERGMEGNTLVIFASDNGPHGDGGTLQQFQAAGPLRGRKRDMYEGGIRVPFLARWPGQVRAGAVSDQVLAFQDILPTFCELAGAAVPAQTDGLSIVPTLLGREGQRQHPHLYWEFYEQGGKQAVRQGDWKAVRLNVHRDRRAPLELYNLKDDPAEQHNLAAQHPDRVRDLAAIMEREHTPSELWTFGPRRQEPE